MIYKESIETYLKCAEHLQPGETYENAAKRGLLEELNITEVQEIENIRTFQLFCFDDDEKQVHDHEFSELFKVKYNGEIKGLYINIFMFL